MKLKVIKQKNKPNTKETLNYHAVTPRCCATCRFVKPEYDDVWRCDKMNFEYVDALGLCNKYKRTQPISRVSYETWGGETK